MPTKQKLRCFNARVGTDLSYCRITGIEVLEDGRILLCDNNNDKVKLFQYDGTFLSDYFVEGFPIDLCMINQYTIVVTNDIGNKLVFLKIVGDKIFIEKDAQITPGAVGICAIDGELLLTYPWCNPPEIVKIDEQGYVIQTFKRDAKRKPIFDARPVSVCFFSNQIYASCLSIDGKKDEIYKFSKDGHILAILEHPKLKEARYVSKDMFGNIYVCNMLKSSIIRFDRSGHGSSVVMSMQDGLRDPCAIGILDQTLVIAQAGLDIIQVLTIERFSENDVRVKQ